MTYTEKKQTTEAITSASTTEQQSNDVLDVRHMKVYPFYRLSQTDSIYGNSRRPTIVPHLRLCGNWLQAAGFLPEELVSITVMKDTLIIKRKQ